MACMEAAAHAERPMQEDTCMQGYLGPFSIAINDFQSLQSLKPNREGLLLLAQGLKLVQGLLRTKQAVNYWRAAKVFSIYNKSSTVNLY